MAKAQVGNEVVVKKGLWSKFTKWLVSKLSCFNTETQDDIADNLEDLGDNILVPAIEAGADALEEAAQDLVPGVGGSILAQTIDTIEDVVVELVGGNNAEGAATS